MFPQGALPLVLTGSFSSGTGGVVLRPRFVGGDD